MKSTVKKKISKAAIAAMFASFSLSTNAVSIPVEFHYLSHDNNMTLDVSLAPTILCTPCFVPPSSKVISSPQQTSPDSTDQERGLYVKDKKGKLNKKDKKGELDEKEGESSSSASSAQSSGN